MKHMKSRIAAVLSASVMTVAAAQGITASASQPAHSNNLCGNTQESAEFGMNFGHNMYYWQFNFPQNSTWTTKFYSGLVLGKGYTEQNISGTVRGQELERSAAWARMLACSNYGDDNMVFTEQSWRDYTNLSQMRSGDQVVLRDVKTNVYHTVFVTAPSSNDRIYCSELVSGNKVKWGVEFSRTSYYMTRKSDSKKYEIMYFLRPAMEGDADGNGIVNSADVTWINNNINNYSFPGKNYIVQMTAADVNGTWQIDAGDGMVVHFYSEDGHMTHDANGNGYHYIKA